MGTGTGRAAVAGRARIDRVGIDGADSMIRAGRLRGPFEEDSRLDVEGGCDAGEVVEVDRRGADESAGEPGLGDVELLGELASALAAAGEEYADLFADGGAERPLLLDVDGHGLSVSR